MSSSTSSSPSLIDSFLALFKSDKSKKKAAAQAAAQAALPTAAAYNGVNHVVTPYGAGTLIAYEGNEIVRVQLDYGVAYMHLSSVVRLQLVRAPAPIGLVSLHPQSAQFVKAFEWGTAVVDPSAAAVQPIYSFTEHNIAVRTPYGSGVLVGHSRADGIVQVRTEGSTIFTTLDQLDIIQTEQQQENEGEAEDEAAEAEGDAEESKQQGASKAKKNKNRK